MRYFQTLCLQMVGTSVLLGMYFAFLPWIGVVTLSCDGVDDKKFFIVDWGYCVKLCANVL